MKPEFSVSLMCLDYLRIREQIEALNSRADYYHIDIMDGHFCKNITLSPDFTRAIKRISTLPVEVHLMTEHPNDFIGPVREAGADIISPHAETINTDAFRTLDRIKALGAGAGVVLNPATPQEYIRHYVSRLDIITIMTVDVGYAGQPFIDEMLERLGSAGSGKKKRDMPTKSRSTVPVTRQPLKSSWTRAPKFSFLAVPGFSAWIMTQMRPIPGCARFLRTKPERPSLRKAA
ncbi:MAG: hypothetical protein LBK77_03130 [Spirochaetaceae bacterium]|jgi:D-allulose-6-phosphate 3-epimerase|nr:hypothetical protein [Spirochaetaceae bacterium]